MGRHDHISIIAVGFGYHGSFRIFNAGRIQQLSVFGYAAWLAGLALRLLVDFWPVSIALLVAAWISIARNGLPEDQQLRSLPSVLFLFPILIVLWGAAAHVEFGVRPGIPWRLAVLAIIIFLHGALSASLIYISRGYRYQTAMLAALIAWVAIACIVQSTLALTGRLEPPGM